MPFKRTYSTGAMHRSASAYRHTYSKKRETPNLTEGPIFVKLLLFCLPLMATNLLQVLYNAADMMVVSLSHESAAVGSIGTTGAFVNLVVNVFIGFATGANVIVARALGAKDNDRASRATHTALVLGVLFGLAGAAIGLVSSRTVLSLMGAEGKVLDLATTYTRIYFLGVPFISVANYLIAIFRAKGDTRTPLLVLSISGIVNVAFNLFFVLVCGMSVEGVAIATSISNLVSAVWLAAILMRDEGPCRLQFRRLHADRQSVKDIIYVGLPAGIQGSLFSISNMLMQSSVLQLNNALCPPETSAFPAVLNGNAAGANLEMFAFTAQNAVYQGAITFTSQHMGARKHKRIYRLSACCYLLGAVIATVMSLIIIFARDPLLALYNVHNGAEGTLDAIAYNTAYLRMIYLMLPYFTISCMDVGCGILRGLGKAISATVITLLGACAFRIIWIFTVFKLFPTLEVLFLSYPISWIITAAVYMIFIFSTLKKRVREEEYPTVPPHAQ